VHGDRLDRRRAQPDAHGQVQVGQLLNAGKIVIKF
jgi:hypothetical protein